MTQEKNVFDRLGRELRKDIVIGGYIACFVAIAALFAWGLYNQHKVNICNERFTNFAIELERRAEQRTQQREREADSLIRAINTEVTNLKRDKEDMEEKLKSFKQKK